MGRCQERFLKHAIIAMAFVIPGNNLKFYLKGGGLKLTETRGDVAVQCGQKGSLRCFGKVLRALLI